MSDVRICVADPHQVVIEGTKSLLRRQMNLDVSGEALTGERILAALLSSPFNVIVVAGSGLMMKPPSSTNWLPEIAAIVPIRDA